MNGDVRRVHISASLTYDVLIGPGLLSHAGVRMRDLFGERKAAIITDDRVDKLYGAALSAALVGAGFSVSKFAFPNGEPQKTLTTLGDILEHLGGAGLSRSDLLVCLGGGVVGDIGGLAAALYSRGTRFVQIPTTLLSAVDSSVGGKTAVNLGAGKNMAGAFAQPSLVLCDTDILRALPAELARDGAAEIVKYGVLQEPALLAWANAGMPEGRLGAVVEMCVAIKRGFTQQDEYDTGIRQLLNLGHTIGHAAEKCARYQIGHGQGVAIGLAAIARASEALGHAQEAVAAPVEAALRTLGLPTECPYGKEQILAAMHADKKRRGGTITLVVPVRIGQCELMPVPVAELGRWLEAGGIR